jgi:D-alanyl-D-alanine carboxypeptidase/D-alanyl-D-alanine-endopeptidase (penicillin-binding protein 4)
VARLKDRNPQAAAIGQAWLKTGSLRDVISLAGYVQGDSGQRYTLVAIVNHANAQAARPALDHLLEWTVHDRLPEGLSATIKP